MSLPGENNGKAGGDTCPEGNGFKESYPKTLAWSAFRRLVFAVCLLMLLFSIPSVVNGANTGGASHAAVDMGITTSKELWRVIQDIAIAKTAIATIALNTWRLWESIDSHPSQCQTVNELASIFNDVWAVSNISLNDLDTN